MVKYAIILPAGSGKTTFIKKYNNEKHNNNKHKHNNVYDIDRFKTTKLKKSCLQQSCIKSLETNDWTAHNELEYNMIYKQIEQLPPNSVVLLHCIEKALLYELIPLITLKINKQTMLEVANKRAEVDGEWRKEITILNWENTKDAIICDSYDEIDSIIRTYLNEITDCPK